MALGDHALQLIQCFLKRRDIHVEDLRQHKSVWQRVHLLLHPVSRRTKLDACVGVHPVHIKHIFSQYSHGASLLRLIIYFE